MSPGVYVCVCVGTGSLRRENDRNVKSKPRITRNRNATEITTHRHSLEFASEPLRVVQHSQKNDKILHNLSFDMCRRRASRLASAHAPTKG